METARRGLVDQRCGPRQVRHDYAFRWRAEDGARFLGQLLHFERFLVRRFVAIYRTILITALAFAFLSELWQDQDSLTQAAMNRILRWSKGCDVPVYPLAAGVRAIAAEAGVAALPHNA